MRSVIDALQMKSLNEIAAQKYRSIRSINYYKRAHVNVETITTMCGLQNPLMKRMPYINKSTMT